MGMLGNYIAVEDLLLKQILDKEKDMLDIDPKQSKTLDIDKSWQAIHFLLCKDIDNGEPPMGYIVPMLDDQGLDCDFDYGAFYITAEQVKEGAAYLNSLDDDTFKKMYDFHSMQEHGIYPLMKEDAANEFYDYIHSYLAELKKFFKETAERGNAIIFYII